MRTISPIFESHLPSCNKSDNFALEKMLNSYETVDLHYNVPFPCIFYSSNSIDIVSKRAHHFHLNLPNDAFFIFVTVCWSMRLIERKKNWKEYVITYVMGKPFKLWDVTCAWQSYTWDDLSISSLFQTKMEDHDKYQPNESGYDDVSKTEFGIIIWTGLSYVRGESHRNFIHIAWGINLMIE